MSYIDAYGVPWPPKCPDRPLISRFTEEDAKAHGLVDDDYRNWYHFDFEAQIPKSRGGGRLVYRASARYDILTPYVDPECTAWDMMMKLARQWFEDTEWDKLYPKKD